MALVTAQGDAGGAPVQVRERPPEQRSVGQTRPKKNYRGDIQGLRAWGILVVLLCHAEFGFAEGGFVALDMFFVLSGFLITGLIVDELERTGTVSLAKFYARRIRRLLPAAIVVIVAIMAASAALFSPVRNDAVAGDAVAASLYFVNWRFAAQAVDYFAIDSLESPLQHFWSLSVEEQFYLVWPALLLGAFLLWVRAGRGNLRRGLWVVVLAMGIPSLAYSGWIVTDEASYSYFSTLTRVWEFAIGGALALVLPAQLKLPRPLVAALAWGGLAVLCWATYAFSQDMYYPGTAALVPCLATIALVAAGAASKTAGPLRLLNSRPAQYLGDISYTWYLWHWPALVFARAEWGVMTPWQNLAIVAAMFVPTALTHRWIEEPLRRGGPLAVRPRRAIAFGFSCMGVAVALAAALVALKPNLVTASAGQVTGARAVENGAKLQKRAEALRPAPREAKDDRGLLYRDGCFVDQSVLESPPCVYGNRRSDTTVVLFGNSHAMHYFPALRRVAGKRDWRLVALTKAGCTVGDVDFAYRCDTWRENSLQRIEQREDPDLVIVASTTSPRLGVVVDGERLSPEDSRPIFEDGYARTFGRLRATGARVAVMKDLPRAPHDIPDCVSRASDRLEDCAFEHRQDPRHAFDARAARRADADVVDIARLVCPDGVCPAVMGNALVYRDDNHFTATFARTFAPWLNRQLPDFEQEHAHS